MPKDTPIPASAPVASNRTLINYLKLSLTSYQASIKLIRAGKVKVNGVIVRDETTVIKINDRVSVTDHIQI